MYFFDDGSWSFTYLLIGVLFMRSVTNLVNNTINKSCFPIEEWMSEEWPSKQSPPLLHNWSTNHITYWYVIKIVSKTTILNHLWVFCCVELSVLKAPNFFHFIVHFHMEKNLELNDDESGECGGWHIFTGLKLANGRQCFKCSIFRKCPGCSRWWWLSRFNRLWSESDHEHPTTDTHTSTRHSFLSNYICFIAAWGIICIPHITHFQYKIQWFFMHSQNCVTTNAVNFRTFLSLPVFIHSLHCYP